MPARPWWYRQWWDQRGSRLWAALLRAISFPRTLPLARWEVFSYSAVLLVAAVLRFWDLGSRAFHHDESLHAYYSSLLADGRGFQHNPLMHGPLQFEATALVFKIFGDSDYTARVIPALIGLLLVATPLLLRRYLGRTGALMTSLLLAFSPTLLYYSRFARNDIYVLLWDLLLVFTIFRYIEERRDRYLYLAAAILAIGVATKEVFFITLLIVGSFLFILSLPDIWKWLRRRIPRSQVAASATMFLLVTTLSLTQGAAFLGLFQDRLGIILLNDDWKVGPMGVPLSQDTGLTGGLLEWIEETTGRQMPAVGLLNASGEGELILGGVTLQALDVAAGFTLLLIILSTALGIWWSGWRWAFAALIFWAIYLALFTTFFTNILGVASGLWQSLGYWLAQQDVRRGDQPWYYYLLLLPTYEFLPLLFGLGLGVWYVLRRHLLEERQRLFIFFLAYWGLCSFLLYFWAGEKMPWLSSHLALPLILAAGMALGRLIDRVPWGAVGEPLLRSWRFPLTALAVAGLLFLLTLRAAFMASYEHSDVPREMLIYTQTSPSIPQLRNRVEALGAATGQGRAVPILLDTAAAFGWPWYWYLRNHTNVYYVDLDTTAEARAEGRVLLLRGGNEKKLTGLEEGYGPPETYAFRQNFPETYKGRTGRGLTPEEILEGLLQPAAWRTVWDYWLHREPPQELGGIDGIAYFPRLSP